MANEIHLTPEGHAKLKAELDELKGPARMRIADAIREAKAHGDLRENAAYHEAKLNQTRLDARIAELEKALQISKIIDTSSFEPGTANLGRRVKLLNIEFDDELDIKLVGDFESDASEGFISINSPLGLVLKGKTKGAEIEVKAPGGTNTYRVLAVD